MNDECTDFSEFAKGCSFLNNSFIRNFYIRQQGPYNTKKLNLNKNRNIPNKLLLNLLKTSIKIIKIPFVSLITAELKVKII